LNRIYKCQFGKRQCPSERNAIGRMHARASSRADMGTNGIHECKNPVEKRAMYKQFPSSCWRVRCCSSIGWGRGCRVGSCLGGWQWGTEPVAFALGPLQPSCNVVALHVGASYGDNCVSRDAREAQHRSVRMLGSDRGFNPSTLVNPNNTLLDRKTIPSTRAPYNPPRHTWPASSYEVDNRSKQR
jgi:hypothetical protein